MQPSKIESKNRNRKTIKRFMERARRDQREAAQALQERVARFTDPRDDWQPPPRID